MFNQKFCKMNLIRKNNHLFPSFSIWDDFLRNDGIKFDSPTLSLPAVNIKETANEFDLSLAVPGMKKDDFKIEVENNKLNISAEVEQKQEEKEEGYIRKEFAYHSFARSFTLPKSVAGETISANYSDGVLNITIPKKEEAKEKAPMLIQVA